MFGNILKPIVVSVVCLIFAANLCAVLAKNTTKRSKKGRTGSGICIKISDELYLGVKPSRNNIGKLKNLGIKTLVELDIASENDNVIAGSGMNCFHLPFGGQFPDESDSIKFIKIATNPDNSPVYVYGESGIDKAAFMIAIYRVYVQRWAPFDAMKELSKRGYRNLWKKSSEYFVRFSYPEMKTKVDNIENPPIQ